MDRRRLLDQRAKAKQGMMDQRLPDYIRALAKKAVDHADVALGLQDALKRKALKGSAVPIPQSGARPMPSEAPIPDLLTPILRSRQS